MESNIGENDWLQVYAARMDKPQSQVGVYTFGKFNTDERARLAWELIRMATFVPSIADGEDKRGNHKLRIPTVSEMTERAFSVVDAYLEESIKRGWIFPNDLREVARLKETKSDSLFEGFVPAKR